MTKSASTRALTKPAAMHARRMITPSGVGALEPLAGSATMPHDAQHSAMLLCTRMRRILSVLALRHAAALAASRGVYWHWSGAVTAQRGRRRWLLLV